MFSSSSLCPIFYLPLPGFVKCFILQSLTIFNWFPGPLFEVSMHHAIILLQLWRFTQPVCLSWDKQACVLENAWIFFFYVFVFDFSAQRCQWYFNAILSPSSTLKKKKKSPGILQEAYEQKNKTKQKSSINSEVHSDMWHIVVKWTCMSMSTQSWY